MANTDTIEWRLLDTNLTTTLAILPAGNSHLYFELNEPGSGELRIPLDSTAAGLVTSGMFCECYYRGSSRGGFFVDNIKEVDAEGAEGEGRWMSLSGRGPLALLDEVIVWDDGTDSSVRTFTSTTRASVLVTLITEAKARGALSNLTYNFDGTTDSAGSAWTDSDDYEFNVGDTLLDVVRDFVSAGTDFTIALSGGNFVLSAWQADYGTDKSSTIYMRVGSNCQEVSTDQRSEELRNALRVKFKSGYMTVSDNTSITNNRRREELLNIEAAQSGDSASTYASVVLNSKKNVQTGITVRVYDGVDPKLFEEYGLGDTVTVDKFGTTVSYRIYGIQVDFGEAEYSNVVLELNTIFRVNELKMSEELDRLLKRWNTARDADQTEVMQWMAIGGNSSGKVWDTFILGDDLYICGDLSGISGKLTSTNSVLKYNFPTGVWSDVGDTSSFATKPYRIQVTATSTVYAMNATEVWKKTSAGSWTRIGLTAAGTFRDIILWDSSAPTKSGLVVAGTFTDTDLGVAPGYWGGMSVWDGTSWQDIQANLSRAMTHYSLALSGTTLMVSGYSDYAPTLNGGEIQALRYDLTTYRVFSTVLGRVPIRSIHFAATNELTYIDTTGEIYQGTVTPGTPHDNFTNIGTVDTFTDSAIETGIYSYLNDIYIHGYMDGVDGVASENVIRYSGGNWESVDGGTTGGSFISTVIFNGENMIVGGLFPTIGGVDIDNLAIHIVGFSDLVDMLSNAGSMDHNSLNGIQGGSSNSYYHLTSAQHTDLTDSGESTLHYHASDRDSANFTGTNWTDLTDGNGTTLHTHAYTALTSKPASETNANDIFRCDNPGGDSSFVGTIATLPGGATLTYNVTSGNEGVMVPFSTSQLAKMRIYNTTRSTSALISNCVTGTNTLTLTANVPAGWQVGDTINIASLTVSGGSAAWVDLEITTTITGKSHMFINLGISSATVGDRIRIHPFETYGSSKPFAAFAQVASIQFNMEALTKITSDVFTISWTGTPTYIVLREMGYLE